MAVPEFATYMNPVLASLKALGGSARAEEVCAGVSEALNLPDEVLDQRLKNGVSRFENQVHWARFYLAKTGYIDSSRRGVWSLSDKGRAVVNLSDSDIRSIIQEVQALAAKKREERREEPNIPSQEATFEAGDDAPVPLGSADYKVELLSILKSVSPAGFERLCQRLLRESGFERVQVTGRSGDGGIDGNGVLQVNPFVSFHVLFQCKRYEGNVTASQVRDFRGAMMGRAEKGIILTTGGFTADAKREAVRDGVPPIELVDGEKLVEMFELLELGLKPRTTYDIDESFFEPFRE